MRCILSSVMVHRTRLKHRLFVTMKVSYQGNKLRGPIDLRKSSVWIIVTMRGIQAVIRSKALTCIPKPLASKKCAAAFISYWKQLNKYFSHCYVAHRSRSKSTAIYAFCTYVYTYTRRYIYILEPSCNEGCTAPPAVTAKSGVIKETNVTLKFGISVSFSLK